MEGLSIERAEELAGTRLDRRRKWYLFDGEVCFEGKFVRSCSGCFETGEYGFGSENYPFDEKANCHIGSGCEECGYTGKRRDSFPIPHNLRI